MQAALRRTALVCFCLGAAASGYGVAELAIDGGDQLLELEPVNGPEPLGGGRTGRAGAPNTRPGHLDGSVPGQVNPNAGPAIARWMQRLRQDGLNSNLLYNARASRY